MTAFWLLTDVAAATRTRVEDKEDDLEGARDRKTIFFVCSGVPEEAGTLYFVGGDPQSAGFCDGQGPGMALEQNPSLPPTRPGGPQQTQIIRGTQ